MAIATQATEMMKVAAGPARWRVTRTDACTRCGICAEVCPAGVHPEGDGFFRLPQPDSRLCLGPGCLGAGAGASAGSRADGDGLVVAVRDCTAECPEKALAVEPSSDFRLLGDPRWPAHLLKATWHEAEHGAPPPGVNYRTGASGGGFDRLRFLVEDQEQQEQVGAAARSAAAVSAAVAADTLERRREAYAAARAEVDLTLPLNRRAVAPGEYPGERITIGLPWYGGGMSYGSISVSTMMGRAGAARRLGTFASTGEGGYPADLAPFHDHVITQVATGLFGVREETLQWARIIEIKYAQGAKPGLGGHLLADKVTRDVAEVREAVEHTNLFSPFPFHSVYSVEDHKKHVDWLKATNPKTLISVKVSTPEDVDMVAVGSYYAGAHIIHLDGGYGGTGAAPDIAKKNIAMPIEFAIPRAHRFLEKEGIRDQVTLMASGGLRTPYDVAKAIALGADGCILGTAELVALGCVRCANCESGRGCPRGIATTDRELTPMITPEWATERIVRMYTAWAGELALLLRRLGMRNVAELRGRTDLLRLPRKAE